MFGSKLGYEGPTIILILSKNLSSILVDIKIIDKKLRNNLELQRVVEVRPKWLFIYALLGLIPKDDEGYKKIHYLSHPVDRSVNNHIPNKAKEIGHYRFQDVLDIVIRRGSNCMIIKQNIKDAFMNIVIAPHHQWLLGFIWRNKYQK